jgi:transcription elongation factor GreA
MTGTPLKDALEAELKTLERELKIELPQEIKKAVAMGDLRENAEYQTALERQRLVQSRIGQLKQKLSELSLVRFDQVPKDRIGLGSLFKVVDGDDDKQVQYEIVMDGMADPPHGKISVSSLLARGFVNKKVGDEVTIIVPSGKRKYEIVELKTVHERE